MASSPTALGRDINNARERAGISRSEMARRLGIDPSLVSKWQIGQRSPGPDMVARVNRVLGSSIEPLDGGGKPAKRTTAKKAAKRTTAKKTAARKAPAKKAAARKASATRRPGRPAGARKATAKRTAPRKATSTPSTTPLASATPVRRSARLLVQIDRDGVHVYDENGEVSAVVLDVAALSQVPASRQLKTLSRTMLDLAALPPSLYRRAASVIGQA